MPYASDKQRAYLHINEPELAKEWDMKYPQRGQRAKKNLSKQSAQAKALRAGSQSPMGKKKTSATGAVGGAG
jgi:hypothetical protein